MSKYAYGMRLRPRQPLAQPNDYINWTDFDERTELKPGAQVWCILWYDRELTDAEIRGYELVRLPEADK